MTRRRCAGTSVVRGAPHPLRLAFGLFLAVCVCVVALAFASTAVVGQYCGYSSCSSCASSASCKWCGTYSSSSSGTCVRTGTSCSSTGYPSSYLFSSDCTNYSTSGGATAGAIVGAVIGSIAFVVFVIALCVCIRRRYLLGAARPGVVVLQQPAQAVVFSPQPGPIVYASGHQPASVHTVYAQQPPAMQGQPQGQAQAQQPFQGQPQTMGGAVQPAVYGGQQVQPGQQQQPYYAAPPTYAQTYAQPPPSQYAPGQQQQPAFNPQYGEGMPQQPAYAPQGQVQYAQPMMQYPPAVQQSGPVFAPMNTATH